ncbi:hypothetical protein Glove_661g43 [Diversispora epigaea]|uniref:CCHC-type domain-containing protein n=1 Tax=Diversispora epigaea TaxID=1348612 RepID=A0A397G3U4_9GLOM|nr:hypothetical protein Glove_661g43 [Diversispora epigaea]
MSIFIGKEKNENYITYLEKEITTRDNEIDILRTQVNNLKIRLRKAEADAQSNDKNISVLKLQLEEMGEDISLLQHRLQKIKEGMSLTTPGTSASVFTLLNETRNNIKILFDSVRGENDLLNDEIDNLQIQTELKLTQIQNKYHIYERENNQLREGLAQEYEDEVGRLQITINEQRDRIDELGDEARNWYQRANQLQGHYDTVLNERDRYRTECFQQEETLRGIHENMAHEGADQLDLEDENANLKEDLRIAGLIIIALRVRRLILINRGRYNRRLITCHNHGQNLQLQLTTAQNDLFLSDTQLNIKWGKWKNRTRNAEQLILNLQGQILHLQNNPLNMTTVAGDLTSISPLIADFKNYSGQILPDEWYQGINKILTLPSITAVGFNDALRTDILKSKMVGKYTDIPAQHAGNNIDTPARFIVWLCHKYQTETVGTQQVAIQRLAQEKFLLFDTPETYETRIRPLLLEVANNDANILGLLKGHLSGDLYTWMRSDNPLDINTFFSSLKNMWLERRPSPSYESQIPQVSTVSEQPSNTVLALITPEENLMNVMKDISNRLSNHEVTVSGKEKKNNSSSNDDMDRITKDVPIVIRRVTLPALALKEKRAKEKLAYESQIPQVSTVSEQPSNTVLALITPEENLMNVMKDISNRLSNHEVTVSGKEKKNNSSSNDDMDRITKGMAKLSLNVAKIKKSLHRCSYCHKTGYTSRTCLKRKKSKRKARVHHISKNDNSESDSDCSNSESGTRFDSGESSGESDHSIDSRKENQSKQTTLEQTIRKIIQSELKEIISPYLLQSFELKFSFIKPAHTEKLPPIQDKIYREPASEIPDSDGEEKTLDDPMEIDLVQRRDPATDIATTECKIKRLIIPAAGLDSCANFPIMTEDIAKCAKLVIDTKEKHDLSGIATTSTESIGTVRNIPVTFALGCTIHSDFAVVKYRKPMLILPNTLLDKYDYDLLALKRVLKLVCNGKEHSIPINMHPVKNKLEVNYVTTSQDDKPLVSDQISQETDEDGDNNVPFEKWCAPEGFSLLQSNEALPLDSDDSTLKKKCMSYEELEKSLYTTLESKAEINDLTKKLQLRYEKLLEYISSKDDSINKEKID